MKPENELEAAILRAARQAVIDQIRKSSGLSLKELGELAKRQGEMAMGITVGEIMEGAAKVGGARRRGPSPGAVDTRTMSGRHNYQQAVLSVLDAAGARMSALEIREAVGGSADQCRRALNRLIELGKVEFEGQTRATRYWTKRG